MLLLDLRYPLLTFILLPVVSTTLGPYKMMDLQNHFPLSTMQIFGVQPFSAVVFSILCLALFVGFRTCTIHPLRLLYISNMFHVFQWQLTEDNDRTHVPWKGTILTGNFIFQPSIFTAYVSFQEGNSIWRVSKGAPEQWKKPWLFSVYRRLYYPVV